MKHTTCKQFTLLVLILVFIWLQTRVLRPDDSWDRHNYTGNTSQSFRTTVNSTFLEYTTARTNSGSHLANIQRKIAVNNQLQVIYNQDAFGPVQTDTIIIVVQVNIRSEYLKKLIGSLSLVRGIERTLLVFSHDVYSDEINDVVHTIEFTRYMQIFYPYSIQTHPHTFPGPDPKDCPRNIAKKQATQLKCQNAQYPDLYGHYREAKFTQTKHHWWWKANFVFTALNVTKNHTGVVLFLEEDHYVLEDFIHMVELMIQAGNKRCPNCNVYTLGNYIRTYAYMHDINKVEVTQWVSNKHNMGMGLRKSTWLEIVKCRKYFCHYDDYNWDWSLLYTSHMCLPTKLKALVVKSSRVFHIGQCGVHHTKPNCDSGVIIDKIARLSRQVANIMFPQHLVLVHQTVAKKVKLRKGNGGWGDIRDHKLCVQIADALLSG